MKVFINGRFLSQKVTGVQRYAFETLLALDALLARGEGPRCEFTLLSPPGVNAPELRAVRFRAVGAFAGQAWEQLVLPVAARGGWLWSFGATGPLSVRRQTVTIHDAAVYAMPSAFSREFRAWYKLALPLLARRAPLTMTVSEFSRAELGRHLGLDVARLRVTGEGWEHVRRIDADVGVLDRNGLRSKRYVLAVSSLTPQKNFQLVVDALPWLRGAGFDVAIAGRLEPRVFGDFDVGSLGSIKRLGYVGDAELRALYEHAGVFVYPSLYEGFGIPPLEAMALDCPVLASTAASIPEVCGDAARYFEPDDAPALARLIRDVMTNEVERQALVVRGRRRLLAHGWEAAARCHLAALSELSLAERNAHVGAPTLAAAAKT
ncbi:MAG: glycosyltransferase family 1 protein [Polyangiaceae bacterium]